MKQHETHPETENRIRAMKETIKGLEQNHYESNNSSNKDRGISYDENQ